MFLMNEESFITSRIKNNNKKQTRPPQVCDLKSGSALDCPAEYGGEAAALYYVSAEWTTAAPPGSGSFFISTPADLTA